jgi:hypothetical protein
VAIFTDQDSNFFIDHIVGADEPVRARDFNRWRQSALVLQSSKGASFPSVYEGQDPPFGIDPDSGAVFECWRRIAADETTSLLDAADYDGVVSPTFGRWGFRGRFVVVTAYAAFVDRQHIGLLAPGGSGVGVLFRRPTEGAFYTGDGSDAHALTLTFNKDDGADDEYDEITLRLDSQGRLSATFTPHAPEPDPDRTAALFVRLDCSPLTPWRDLSGPESPTP